MGHRNSQGKRNPPLKLIHIAVSPRDRRRGTLIAGGMAFPCALGRSGARLKRREGDGITPIGTFALRLVHWRDDRVPPPLTRLAKRRIQPNDWWCDVTSDRAYNCLVRLRPPPAGSEERLKRADRLYDIVVEIGYNDRPAVRGRGSGIFWHIARPGFTPTAGCVATTLRTLQRLLPRVGPRTRLRIG